MIEFNKVLNNVSSVKIPFSTQFCELICLLLILVEFHYQHVTQSVKKTYFLENTMNDPDKLRCKYFRRIAIAIIFVQGVSGCSGSSDSTTLVSDSNRETNNSTEIEFEISQEELTPSSHTTTDVFFEITVPVYVSNELQVRLYWGEVELLAQWIGDEFWSVSVELPTETEHALEVNFYDKNGDIQLGTVERLFETGMNSAEDVYIAADDFDTVRWDDDSDGVSNIAELRMGTDPLGSNELNELEQINLLDAVTVTENIGYAAAYYELELLTLEYPVDIHEDTFVDNLPYQSVGNTLDIVMLADGNGTYSKTYDLRLAPDAPFHRSSVGTRSELHDTVTWSGIQLLRSSSVFYNAYVEEVFETSNTLSGRELIQQSNGTITGKEAAYEQYGNIRTYSYEIVLDLDSMDSENTCVVLHGNITSSFEQQVDNPSLSEQTVSRSSADDNWVWVSTVDAQTTQGEAIALTERFYCNFQIH